MKTSAFHPLVQPFHRFPLPAATRLQPSNHKIAVTTSSLSLDPTLPLAASTWLPGTLELSGQLFVFDGGVPVPGSATAMRLPTCEYCIEVRCKGALS